MCCVLSHLAGGSIFGSDHSRLLCDEIENLARPYTASLRSSFHLVVGVVPALGTVVMFPVKVIFTFAQLQLPGDKAIEMLLEARVFFIEMCNILCEYGTCCGLFKFQSA